MTVRDDDNVAVVAFRVLLAVMSAAGGEIDGVQPLAFPIVGAVFWAFCDGKKRAKRSGRLESS